MEKYLFDKIWFQKHQKTLLWLLNHPILKYWFRWILRIKKYDCKSSEKIIQLQPNNYKVDLGSFLIDGKIIRKIKADFRTHNKFSKRIYHAFYAIWWTMHQWDMFIANKFAPQLNLGFDTLTAYPDAHTETSTVDGFTCWDSVDETWSTIRGHTDSYLFGDTDAANHLARLGCSATTNQMRHMYRGILLFDTSSIGSSATINSAVFSFYAKILSSALGGAINIVSSNPASNTAIVSADYSTLGTTKYASDVDISSLATSQYNDWTFVTAGKNAINKTGITKLGARTVWDIDNSAPSWVSEAESYCYGYYADQTGTDKDPKLVVVYSTVSGPVNVKTVNGLAKASVKTVNGLALSSVKSINGLT